LDNGNRSEDYFDKLSFGRAASAASDRSNTGTRGGRTSVANDDHEKLRRDYEFKIATMQSRITGLERDLSDADDIAKKWKDGEERVRLLEEELAVLRRVSVTSSFTRLLSYLFFFSAWGNRRSQCKLFSENWMN
jgi:hypothetical protein